MSGTTPASVQPDSGTWATHLCRPAAGGAPGALPPALSAADAARVQRHRDHLLAALQARDRQALREAKARVLADAYGLRCDGAAASAGPGPALRRALRELAWHMSAWLPRRRLD